VQLVEKLYPTNKEREHVWYRVQVGVARENLNSLSTSIGFINVGWGGRSAPRCLNIPYYIRFPVCNKMNFHPKRITSASCYIAHNSPISIYNLPKINIKFNQQNYSRTYKKYFAKKIKNLLLWGLTGTCRE